MIVVIGSENRVKIEGTIEAYKLFGIDAEFRNVKVSSGVSKQPKRLEEVVRGAFNRAYNALKSISDASEGVGIESGLMHVPIVNKVIDITVAVIVDKLNRVSIGFSSGFEIPPNFVHELFSKDIELEDLVIKLTGIEDIGEKGGFISYLSNGLIERRELVKQAVIMALIPRICKIKDMYGFK